MHRLCAVMFVLCSLPTSLQAQDGALREPAYADDCVGAITEPTLISAPGAATEPRVAEPTAVVEETRDVAAELIEHRHEAPIAERSQGPENKLNDGSAEANAAHGVAAAVPVEETAPTQVSAIGKVQERDGAVEPQSQIELSQPLTDGKVTDGAIGPTMSGDPTSPEPMEQPSTAELARMIEGILSESPEPEDDTAVSKQANEPDSKQTDEVVELGTKRADVGISANANAEEVVRPRAVDVVSDDTSMGAAGNPVGQSSSAENLSGDEGRLPNIVEESSEVRSGGVASTDGLSQRADGEALNAFSDNLE